MSKKIFKSMKKCSPLVKRTNLERGSKKFFFNLDFSHLKNYKLKRILSLLVYNLYNIINREQIIPVYSC